MTRTNSARRAVLTTIMALGTVISVAGASGIFAVFTDRATTGENDFRSRPEPRPADVQLAIGTHQADGSIACGAFTEDLTTSLIDLSTFVGLPPGAQTASQYVCVSNAGGQTVDVDVSAIELVDVDHACTGAEAVIDPGSCGGDLEGELSQFVEVQLLYANCVPSVPLPSPWASLADLQTTPLAVATLAPGAVTCLAVVHSYAADEVESQLAQSDSVQWKYAFDATTAA